MASEILGIILKETELLLLSILVFTKCNILYF